MGIMKPVKPIGPDKRKQLDALYKEAEFVAYDAIRGIGIYKVDEEYYVYQHDTLRKKGDVRSVREFLEKDFVDVKPAPINNMQESYTFMDYLSSLGLAPDEEQFNKQQEYKEKTYQKGCYTWSEYFAETKKDKQVGVLYNQDRKREISTNGENVEKGVELKESVEDSVKPLKEAVKLDELEEDSTLDEVIASIDACNDSVELLEFANSNGLWYAVSDGRFISGSTLYDNLQADFSEEGISVSLIKSWAESFENIDEIEESAWYYDDKGPYRKIEGNDYIDEIKSTLKDFIEDERMDGTLTLYEI